ncbi:vWA domain-containing protein [Amygdalobacter nucleatus]|uniref:von Willebrand factor type A domain protein n=1 Tax=Amygdalobacter nucleatus TaxID=3029274 RepID=A0A133YHM4_9FIRM|nr:vWA domain-containing protein [Amygdalobacter nucleatus]KXB42694.1 von Willebrand factor type A domain protein [Amygdalobacter nucleatus]MDF0486242.1 VWA domain-containing protein [Amygdalobacter nucleatus]
MKKIVGKYAAKLTVLLTALSLFGSTLAYAEDSAGASSDAEYLEKMSKTTVATQLDKNDEVQIELKFPGKEDVMASDVVFVIDKSSSGVSVEKSIEFLNNVRDQVTKKGLKVKVGVVKFNRIAEKSKLLDISENYDTLIEYLNEKKSGGTNIHAGLLEAKRLLDEDQGVLPQNKHVVLISDGLTYLYCKNDDPSVGYTRTFGTNAGTLYDWSARFGIGQNDQAMTKVLFKDDGKEYTYNSIQENATNFAKYMNHYKDDVEYSKYDGVFHKDEANINIDPDTPEMPHSNDPNIAPSEDVMKMPSNLWVAFKRADETWQDMKNEDYNLHVFADNANATGIGKCFLQYLNRSDNSDIQTFDPDYLQRSVLQIVDKGSTLVDTIGKHFNFVNNPKNISLQIGQDTFNAEKIDGKENEYKFGDKATLKYMPGDNESITLTLNTALTPQTYASLKYSVKLDKDSNLPTEAGTHKLATNESAVLKAVDGNNKPHGQFVFKSPEVDYSVSRPCPKPCPEPEPAKPDVIPYVASDPTEPVVTEVEEPKVGKVAKTGELAGVSSELGLVVLLVAGMIANKRKH